MATNKVKELEQKIAEKDTLIVFLANMVLQIFEKINQLNFKGKPTFLSILANLKAVIDIISFIIEQQKLFNQHVRINNDAQSNEPKQL